MERIRNRYDQVAWQEFFDFYGPLIYRYGRQRGLGHDDAEEIIGRCFENLNEAMGHFEYDPQRGKFKSWLKKLVNNKINDFLAQRREGRFSESRLELQIDPRQDLEQLWEQSWRQELLNYCTALVRREIPEAQYQVFQLNVLEGCSAERVAELLSISCEQVYRQKYKVLQKIREKMQNLLDEESRHDA
ncbi:MAG: hypothetical protein HJJLKODD_01917 [Phycisphaerae bacterium]|nr:hypothetical protein [Phycisphaerae bacterium]